MLICRLSMAYFATVVVVTGCMAHRTWNIYYLAFNRQSMLTSSLNVFWDGSLFFSIRVSHLVWAIAVVTKLVIARASCLKCRWKVDRLSNASISPHAWDVSGLPSKAFQVCRLFAAISPVSFICVPHKYSSLSKLICTTEQITPCWCFRPSGLWSVFSSPLTVSALCPSPMLVPLWTCCFFSDAFMTSSVAKIFASSSVPNKPFRACLHCSTCMALFVFMCTFPCLSHHSVNSSRQVACLILVSI